MSRLNKDFQHVFDTDADLVPGIHDLTECLCENCGDYFEGAYCEKCDLSHELARPLRESDCG